MWLVQRHESGSDGLDYMRLFMEYNDALEFYLKAITANLEFENFTPESCLATLAPGITFLEDGDYISLMEIHADGTYARSRP
jgi:hypothetical protein